MTENDPEYEKLAEIELELEKAAKERRVATFRVPLDSKEYAIDRMVLDKLVRDERLIRWVRPGATGLIACYQPPQIPRE